MGWVIAVIAIALVAVAIAIDATIVRCLAVPAVMTLMNRAAWWLPAWLARILPPISIEGGDYFDRHAAADALATQAAAHAPAGHPVD